MSRQRLTNDLADYLVIPVFEELATRPMATADRRRIHHALASCPEHRPPSSPWTGVRTAQALPTSRYIYIYTGMSMPTRMLHSTCTERNISNLPNFLGKAALGEDANRHCIYGTMLSRRQGI